MITRRNELVHNLSGDPEVIMAAADGTGMQAVVTRIEQIALDAGVLAVELHTVAVPKLEEKWGSRDSLAEKIKAIDPEQVKDPRARRQIGAVRALGDSDLDLRDPFIAVR